MRHERTQTWPWGAHIEPKGHAQRSPTTRTLPGYVEINSADVTWPIGLIWYNRINRGRWLIFQGWCGGRVGPQHSSCSMRGLVWQWRHDTTPQQLQYITKAHQQSTTIIKLASFTKISFSTLPLVCVCFSTLAHLSTKQGACTLREGPGIHQGLHVNTTILFTSSSAVSTWPPINVLALG